MPEGDEAVAGFGFGFGCGGGSGSDRRPPDPGEAEAAEGDNGGGGEEEGEGAALGERPESGGSGGGGSLHGCCGRFGGEGGEGGEEGRYGGNARVCMRGGDEKRQKRQKGERWSTLASRVSVGWGVCRNYARARENDLRGKLFKIKIPGI